MPSCPSPAVRIRSDPRHDARLLRDLLRAEILEGGFPQGRLPAETAIMAEYGAPRATVRTALDLLRRAGLLERTRGTGTLVVARRYALRLPEAHGVNEALVDAHSYTPRVLERRVVPMPSPVARFLDDEPGTPCLLLEYLGLVEGRVSSLCTNYLRFPEAEAIGRTPFTGHWYTLLARAGADVAHNDFLIESVLADAAVADLLEVAEGAPLLAMQQVLRDSTGRAYDFALLRCRADAVSLTETVERRDHGA